MRTKDTHFVLTKIATLPSKYISDIGSVHLDPLASILGRIRDASRFTDANSHECFTLAKKILFERTKYSSYGLDRHDFILLSGIATAR